MRPIMAWLVFATVIVFAFAELLSAAPFFSPFLAGAVLLVVGVLAGLRWATDAASRLISDLARKNAYLAEQNDQLSDLNYELLTHLNEAVEEQATHE